MKTPRLALAAAFAFAASAAAASAATIDTIDASSGQAGTFFVPDSGQVFNPPYYRGFGEGWGWQHNAILDPFTTASLNISAFDVDEEPCGLAICEIDRIEAFDALSATWVILGDLTGEDNAFSFTEFDLVAAAGGALIDDVTAGLQLRMTIDFGNGGWLVTLAKSVITTDGRDPGNPNPNPIPLPAASFLLLAGLGGLGLLRRRKA
jgi:hypothetical protein